MNTTASSEITARARVAASLLAVSMKVIEIKLGFIKAFKSIETYAKRLRGLTRGLWKGDIDRLGFEDSIFRLMRREFNNAWIEGARTQGVEPEERTPEEEAKLQEIISTQATFIPGLADFILAHSNIFVHALPSPVAVEAPPGEFKPTPAEPTAPAPTGTGDTFANTISYRESKNSGDWDESVNAMDRVIGTGQGEYNTKLKWTSNMKAEGRYSPNTGKIEIRHTKSGNSMTTLHEIGHSIDHELLIENLGGPIGNKWASVQQANPEFFIEGIKEIDDYWKVVDSSKTIKKFRAEALEHGDAGYDYMLDSREVFARSFAQYVAEKTQDKGLLWELNNELEDQWYPLQWSHSDFKPILKAMDKLFDAAGMLL